MKNTVKMMVSSIIGSGLTIAVFLLTGLHQQSSPLARGYQEQIPVHHTTFPAKENGEIVPLDFTGVSQQAMNSVVHIRSTRKVRASRNQFYYNSPDPFGDLFGDDFMQRFWGMPRQNGQPRQQMEPQTQVGTGSGVVISSKGYIVTNNHVVEGADEIEVTLHDNDSYKARVIGTDPSTDLALLQIRNDRLPAIAFGNSDRVEVGEWVMAIGNPFNLNSTVTAGIVSAKGRNINIIDDQSAIEAFIQTDAAINPGNSGGALVNLEGELIGINTAIASPTGAYAGYGFAIPVDIVNKVVHDLMKYGMVQRAYLGIMIRDVNGELAKQEDLDIKSGAYVDSLTTTSAAAEAGIRKGDVIVGVDNAPIEQSADLLEQIGKHHPGDQVDVRVNRRGRELTCQVTLADEKGMKKLAAREELDIIDILGASLEPLDHETAAKLDIPGGMRVTKLGDGILKNQTEIREGFIITGINHHPVSSEKDVRRALSDEDGGVLVQGIYENYPGEMYFAFGLPE